MAAVPDGHKVLWIVVPPVAVYVVDILGLKQTTTTLRR
jgi:hypothetical protein